MPDYSDVLTSIGAAINKPPSEGWRQGRVVSVTASHTSYNVSVGGVTINAVVALSGIRAQVDDMVWIAEIGGGRWIIVGTQRPNTNAAITGHLRFTSTTTRDAYTGILEPGDRCYVIANDTWYRRTASNAWLADKPINSTAQVGMLRFVDVTTRDAYTGTLEAGDFCYVGSTDIIYMRSNNSTWRVWQAPASSRDALSWVPTFYDITLGNGLYRAKYRVIAGECRFTFNLTFGSTTAWVAGVPRISLPYAFGNASPAFDDNDMADANFQTTYLDATNGRSFGRAFYDGTQNAGFLIFNTTALTNYTIGVVPSSTVPFTWTTNDRAMMTGRYVPYQV